MTPSRGQIWWVDFGEPRGSTPAFRRPALIVQANAFNRSRIRTVLVAPLTTNLRLGDAPGNVVVSRQRSTLPQDSVINVSLVGPIDRDQLIEHHSELPADTMLAVDDGLRRVLSL